MPSSEPGTVPQNDGGVWSHTEGERGRGMACFRWEVLVNQASWLVLLLTLFGCSGDTTTADSDGSDTVVDTDTSATGEALYLS